MLVHQRVTLIYSDLKYDQTRRLRAMKIIDPQLRMMFTRRHTRNTFFLLMCASICYIYIYMLYIYGCESKYKVWIKLRAHMCSRPTIQTCDPDPFKENDPDVTIQTIWWTTELMLYIMLSNLASSQTSFSHAHHPNLQAYRNASNWGKCSIGPGCW